MKAENKVKQINKQNREELTHQRTNNSNRYRFPSEQNKNGCFQRRRNRSFLRLPGSRRRSRFFLYSRKYFFFFLLSIRNVVYLNFCAVSGMGAAYGTAKSGVGVASMGVMRPELVMKSIVPVVMAGVLGIYGLIIAVIISTGINPKAKSYYLFDGYAHLSSGLACGLAGLSAGMAIGIVGDAGVRYSSSQSSPFHHELTVLPFFESSYCYCSVCLLLFSYQILSMCEGGVCNTVLLCHIFL